MNSLPPIGSKVRYVGGNPFDHEHWWRIQRSQIYTVRSWYRGHNLKLRPRLEGDYWYFDTEELPEHWLNPTGWEPVNDERPDQGLPDRERR